MRRPDLLLRRVDREDDFELFAGRATWWWRPWKWRLIEWSGPQIANVYEGRAWRRATAVATGRHFRSVLTATTITTPEGAPRS